MLTSIRKQTEQCIREAIAIGEFSPGEHLAERMLCERFDVSRTMVREVVRGLEGEGFVKIIPNRGVFVEITKPRDAVQIYELRATLEAQMAKTFSERASEEELAHARKVLAELKAAANIKEAIVLKQALYDVMLRGCRNTHLARVLKQLTNPTRLLRETSLSVPGRLWEAIKEVEGVVLAAEERDGERASIMARKHVENACVVALSVLRKRAI